MVVNRSWQKIGARIDLTGCGHGLAAATRVILEFAAQSAARNSKRFGGLGVLPAHAVQSLQNHPPLYFFQGGPFL